MKSDTTYRVLAYHGSENLGDAVQTIALSRLLSRHSYSHVYRHRWTLGEGKSTSRLVLNGFFDCTPDKSDFNVLPAGIFITSDVQTSWVSYLKKLSCAVGARDPFTHNFLTSNGIKSELIGCATLTLDHFDGSREGVYYVDCEKQSNLSHVVELSLSWREQWQKAVSLLRVYQRAKEVHTTRLHVFLPCLAFGTPVRLIKTNVMHPERLSLLDALGVEQDVLVVKDVKVWRDKFLNFLSSQGVTLPSIIPDIESVRSSRDSNGKNTPDIS